MRSSDSLIRKSAGVLIGLGLLAWLLSQVDLENITNMIAQTDLRWFAVGCLAYLVSSLFRAYRFVQLTHSPLERISDMAVVVVAMSLANQILPARLGELS
ncbi:MAG: flippase-like domain-containing protein, partial [Anaerolineales bacterium]|nr:flippase-like domain-containing protein [Anaerolineales bacterium]